MSLDLPESLSFRPEAAEEVQGRYTGFGSNLLESLRQSIPAAYSHLAFFRPTDYQDGDVGEVHLAAHTIPPAVGPGHRGDRAFECQFTHRDRRVGR